MKASELKINNLVTGLYEPVAVIKSICEDELWGGYYVITEKNKTTLEMLLPIPLTETHLLQFGFEYKKEERWFEKGAGRKTMAVWFDDEQDVVHIFCKFNIGMNWEDISPNGEYEYVHQLQNLYHALTGEELTEKH